MVKSKHSGVLVPFGDQRREVAELRTEIAASVDRVLASGWFILGPEVEAFEREFAQWLGAPYAVGVASGTEAITLALMALGVGEGDEVITVANTCVPTAAGIAASGARVRLADCDPETLMVSPESLSNAITNKTRAIVPVHLYGNAADMVELGKLAAQYGLFIVEDCAQAVGTRIVGRSPGSFGDAGAFSFYPTKNLGAYGDGGCVTTADPEVARRLTMLRNYGYQQRDYSVQLGLNSRLDSMQAAILRGKLPYVDSWNARRIAIAQRYQAALKGKAARMPVVLDHVAHSFHLFPILVEERDQVRSRLQVEGIQTLIHYPTPLHLQPALAGLGYKLGDFPHAEWACSHVLSLPIFPQLRDEEVEHVIQALEEVLS